MGTPILLRRTGAQLGGREPPLADVGRISAFLADDAAIGVA